MRSTSTPWTGWSSRWVSAIVNCISYNRWSAKWRRNEVECKSTCLMSLGSNKYQPLGPAGLTPFPTLLFLALALWKCHRVESSANYFWLLALCLLFFWLFALCLLFFWLFFSYVFGHSWESHTKELPPNSLPSARTAGWDGPINCWLGARAKKLVLVSTLPLHLRVK